MRFARTAGLLLAILALVRCGAPVREAPPARAEPRAVEVALAPAPRAVDRSTTSTTETPSFVISIEKQVRELVSSLAGPHCGISHAMAHSLCVPELLALGASAYPIYERILTDPNSTAGEVTGVCVMLDDLGDDARQFAPFIVRRLAAPDEFLPREPARNEGKWDRTRIFLVQSLSYAGDERHAWVLVPLLNDESSVVKSHAARALTQLGGPRELDALTGWLALQNPNLRLVADLRKARDAREQQLRARPARRTF